MRDFEERLIDLWLRMKGKTVRVMPRTGVWIKGHLEDVGEDYCYRAAKLHNLFIDVAKRRGVKGLRYSPYEEFCIYWWFLAREDLIIPTRTEPSLSGQPRQYYALNPLVSNGRWEDVYQKPPPPRTQV